MLYSYYQASHQASSPFAHYAMQVRLAGMLEQFTKIDLLSISKLKSIYSIRLYEIISQFGSTGYRVISLDDFRFSMDCLERYKENKELIKFVVKPALKEINQKKI